MPFTSNPVVQTLVTRRFSFTGSNEQRGATGDKDQKYVNFIPEKTVGINKSDSTWWLKVRPGISSINTMPLTGTPRGIYFWNSTTPAHMSVIGSNVYYNNTFLSTIATSTGQVGFTEFLDSSGARKLIMLDGTNGYVFTAYNVVPTIITSPNFPTPHAPTPIFLDGYLFVAKPGTQDIHNSNLDDPLLWTAGDFISAELYPDAIVGLSRNNNYIYAIGQYSIEYFYDAGTASGSPLARHNSAIQQFGTPSLGTVVDTDQEVILVAQTGAGGRTVFMIDGFKETEIATPAIKNALNAEGAAILNASAASIKVGGQKLYILYLTNRVFVWGFEEKVWFEWNFVNRPAAYADSNTGYPYLLISVSGTNYLATMTPSVFSDVGSTITCTIVTAKIDFDTMDRKRMNLLVLVGDSPTSGSTNISVEWSDDDYNTWSTIKQLALNTIFSGMYRLGMFRRRAFRFTYTAAAPLRLEGMELTINKGQT